MQKEHLLAELNASFKELDKYKQNNPKSNVRGVHINIGNITYIQ
jgi:hypothetical protein